MTIDEYAEWAGTVAKVAAAPGNEKLSYLGLGLSSPVKSPTTSRSCCVMVISIRQR
jgi:hypothetical protein